MRIRLLPLLCLAGLLGLAAGGPATAKILPRVAIDDPAKAKDDPDFAAQGEYVGEWTMPGAAERRKSAVQVVARGGGEFAATNLPGGLPGAGWLGKPDLVIDGKRDGQRVLFGKNGDTAVLVSGSFNFKNGILLDAALDRTDRLSPTLGLKPPGNAVILFAGPGDEKNWAGGKLSKLSDGEFLSRGTKSKQAFGAFTGHIEFRLPYMPYSRGQGRGNSGFYFQDRYELQVLDSFGLSGENNECGGFYTLHKPKVNMCLPPLVWQTYDVDFTPAVFGGDGKKTANARATVRHNGVLIHDNVELPRVTGGNGLPESPAPGPIQLQDHGDPVVYRNIWVVEKP